MRTIIAALSAKGINPSTSITVYSDRQPAALVLGSLKSRGYRQLTVTVQNAVAETLTLQQAASPEQAMQAYDSFAVPVYSSTNKNTYVWDLTSLGEIALSLTAGAGGGVVTLVVEASDDVEALRSC